MSEQFQQFIDFRGSHRIQNQAWGKLYKDSLFYWILDLGHFYLKMFRKIHNFFQANYYTTQSARAVEYTDCIFAEWVRLPSQ